MTQIAGHVKMALISQLINGISRVLWKLLIYYNETAIFAFIMSELLVLSTNFELNLNDSGIAWSIDWFISAIFP